MFSLRLDNKSRMSGDVQVRFCESLRVRFPWATRLMFLFQRSEEAERFYKVLPQRLEKYGLQLHEDKSSLLKSGGMEAKEAAERGERLKTYKFLGFICFWGKSRDGKWWRLKFKSRSDRFTAKLKGLREYLKKSLNQDMKAIILRVKRVVVGWINYHAISDNQRRVKSFLYESKKEILNWINRKGGKRRMTWVMFDRLLKETKYPQSFKTTSMFTACWSECFRDPIAQIGHDGFWGGVVEFQRSTPPCSLCCPPSISMISFFSMQMKSTMYDPIGDCLRNFKPINRILSQSPGNHA